MTTVEQKSELLNTRIGAATLGTDIGALMAATFSMAQNNLPSAIFDVTLATAITLSNHELREELIRIGKLAINLIKPKIHT